MIGVLAPGMFALITLMLRITAKASAQHDALMKETLDQARRNNDLLAELNADRTANRTETVKAITDQTAVITSGNDKIQSLITATDQVKIETHATGNRMQEVVDQFVQVNNDHVAAIETVGKITIARIDAYAQATTNQMEALAKADAQIASGIDALPDAILGEERVLEHYKDTTAINVRLEEFGTVLTALQHEKKQIEKWIAVVEELASYVKQIAGRLDAPKFDGLTGSPVSGPKVDPLTVSPVSLQAVKVGP